VTDLPGGVTMGVAMTSLNSSVYIFGGLIMKEDIITNIVYTYDGTQWKQKAVLPTTLSYHTAIALDTDRALICGGYIDVAETRATNACRIYSASKDAWTQAPPMANTRAQHAMVSLQGCYSDVEC
jgi:hypothetical protein